MVSAGSAGTIIVIVIIIAFVGLMLWLKKVLKKSDEDLEKEEYKDEQEEAKLDNEEYKELSAEFMDEELEKRIEQSELRTEQMLYIYLNRLLSGLRYARSQMTASPLQAKTISANMARYADFAINLAKKLLRLEKAEKKKETDVKHKGKHVLRVIKKEEKISEEEKKNINKERK